MEITSQSACDTNPSITARLRMATGLKKASSLSAPQGNPRRRKPPTVTPAAGDAVQWKWLGITGIFAVSDPVSVPDGTAEVFSRMLKRQEIPAAFLPPPAAAA